MYAYIGSEFFQQVLGVSNEGILISVETVCALSSAAMITLTRLFPTLDNYFRYSMIFLPKEKLQDIKSIDRDRFLSELSPQKKVMIRLRQMPLSIFRCGYAYAAFYILRNWLSKPNDDVSTSISSIFSVLLGSSLFYHSYCAELKHGLNNKILINAPDFEEEKTHPLKRNQILKGIAVIINLGSQIAWGITTVAFLNTLLEGLIPLESIIAASAAVGAEVGYTSYFYIDSKIKKSVPALADSLTALFKKFRQPTTPLVENLIPQDYNT